ncbi:hypothetical protein D082_30150 [Synechocystis sp. PCC 6714]|nr:hypothetical protein D082_30150 [Synechocystis sp. PCC 6714]
MGISFSALSLAQGAMWFGKMTTGTGVVKRNKPMIAIISIGLNQGRISRNN